MTNNPSTVENAKEKLDLWLKQGLTVSGGKLPSERELGELLGIKRMTLRQALLSLEAESRIFRKDRKGWFVAQPRLTIARSFPPAFSGQRLNRAENRRGVLSKRYGRRSIPTSQKLLWPPVLRMIYI